MAPTSCVAIYSVTNVSIGPQSCWQFLKQSGAMSVTMLRMPLPPAQAGSPAKAWVEGHCFLRSSADIGNITPKELNATKTFLHSS
eukprot:CAMPEP_0204024288 /NCGR_PEP_ID=MMETSP0360-20130528/38646_1 /ASSEMBLY_ACC=CAM_ASM_000342 /TAXON_ID=268821 /ORGANISM="Scrippsiella Hangoei, Strain SHTV-5" /LENGTH=84 /DNA_ID=CAMNT_0050967797 /DNA_START=80 /DNA_END=331 /DNA_ORIENTATION=-